MGVLAHARDRHYCSLIAIMFVIRLFLAYASTCATRRSSDEGFLRAIPEKIGRN